MNAGKRYVLDANVFIEAHQKYYAFDLCPGFWGALARQHMAKRVFSVDRVKDELATGQDQLSRWVNDTVPATFFKKTADRRVIHAFATLAKWVQAHLQFTAAAKTEFLSSAADGWVVAYAMANGLTVVTHEEYAPDAKRKVPIPNLCVEFQAVYCNTFEMLRDLKEQFVLRKRRLRN
jgi:predicted nucleic acid-binding protein